MARAGLFRATLTLLAGGALAQLLPLALGPWLTRLYSPVDFGHFGVIWTLATNLAVVGCARYEFALPFERDEASAALLMSLCARVLAVVTTTSIVVAAVLVHARDTTLFWWLPLAVLVGGTTQWLTLWATRAERYRGLAVARVLQHGGGALLQLFFGLLHIGAMGLLMGSVSAGLAVAACLARPAPAGGWAALARQSAANVRAMAVRHRDFPLLNTPHAFLGALQDSLTLLLIAAWSGDAAAGYWALALRYLKAPAGLIGGALSQALYPRLATVGSSPEGLQAVRHSMAVLMMLALPLILVLLLWGPALFASVFGEPWHVAGDLAQALAAYIGMHFVASPLSIATIAWNAQGWALRLAVVGQLMFVGGVAIGLWLGGLIGAGWGVSVAMLAYFSYFFWSLAHWKHESLA
jgi:O-antigen/teichoic acid export membrane protein